MNKNYRSKAGSDFATLLRRYNDVVTDIDARLAALEQPVHAVALADKVGDEIPFDNSVRGPYPRSTKDKEALIDELRLRVRYLEGKLKTSAQLMASWTDKYWAEKIARTNERNEFTAKVRQFAKETVGA